VSFVKLRERILEISEYDEIVILGTGPSLDKGIDYLKHENNSKTLIISLKQSYLKLDFYKGTIVHLLNPWNYQNYGLIEKKNRFRIYYHDHIAKFHPNVSFDYEFLTNYDLPMDLRNSLLYKGNYDDWFLSNNENYIRPLMPGIFGEALFLSQDLECKNIKIFGVDYSSINASGRHFFDFPVVINKFIKFFARALIVKYILNYFNFRTEFSDASAAEYEIAIPGLTKFMTYLEKNFQMNFYGWSHWNDIK
tara:strand:- start:10694 stop:11443 length:750 start_codon:yes stop_codon:yes gene_type:complete